MGKKVVIVVPYSYPSACGVWSRAYLDAKALIQKGFDVSVFSTNIIKGTNQISSDFEEYEGIKIFRFKVSFKIGANAMFWGFYRKLKEISPEVIHTHIYRHPHSLLSLFYAKLIGAKTFLTTHAPFIKDSRRSIVMKLFDIFYDFSIGWWSLKFYNKVIRITKWEEKYLKGLFYSKSIYITNPINPEFLLNERVDFSKKNTVLYMGRIDPVKRPEWLIYAAKKLPDINFKVIGPLNGYSKFEYKLPNLHIEIKKYSYQDYIKELNECDIYVLPSQREALSLTLIEALSQGVVAISTNSMGGQEVISDGKNGFIVMNECELVSAIERVYSNFDEMTVIRRNAIERAKFFNEKVLSEMLTNLYNASL